MAAKILPEEIDYEDIPFVFAESSSDLEPSPEEVSIIAATLAVLYPYQPPRLWGMQAKLSAISNRIHS